MIVRVGCGPGRFAEIVLETMQRQFQRMFAATTYFLDESSSSTVKSASARLERFREQVKSGRLAASQPIQPGIVFGNELLDAFPVHRVTMADRRLREFYVGVDGAGQFAWV